MVKMDFCAGCAPSIARTACLGSFKRLGIIKVHWECWSECNLACSFCYRTKGLPIDTTEAENLISAVKTSGATQIVFAGGDPSLRPDITHLIKLSQSLNLQVEVQTNAHNLKREFIEALTKVDLVGLSLDGPDASTHDDFRRKPGNFRKVMSLLHLLNEKGVPVTVRSLVAKRNYAEIPRMTHLLVRFPVIVKWSLLEFSAVGEGYVNSAEYNLERTKFNAIADEVQRSFPGPAEVDVYRNEAKIGTYALITPHGYVYGTSMSATDGVYPTIGSILREHLNILAGRLPFSKEHHVSRYGYPPQQ